ncbi:MAG: hypothetical protein [Caudoviricetes sp.]|nr:MAG: hypothetical protein [Caudoviricetes sp.]
MQHQWIDVEPKMIGMWQDALTTMTDIDSKCFNGKHQPCPSCGGSDRFRFDNERNQKGDGGAICSQCGSGSGIHWLSKLTGWGFSDCVNALGDFLNLVPPEQIQVKKKNIQTFSARNNASASLSPEQVQSIMAKAVEFPTHIYPLECGVAPDPLMIIQKEKTDGNGEKVVTDSRIAVPAYQVDEFPAKGKSPSLTACNVALIDKQGGMNFVAGKTENNSRGLISFGSVHVIGENVRNSIYLCADWADAWHTHYMTGAQVWCCFTTYNLDMVAHKFRSECESGAIRIAANYDFDELCEAEKNGCKVIIPKSRGRINDGSGFEKAIFDPGSLLDAIVG